jgi:hypothetical protein
MLDKILCVCPTELSTPTLERGKHENKIPIRFNRFANWTIVQRLRIVEADQPR